MAIKLIGSLILICGYISYRRGLAPMWANRALLTLALFVLAYGLIDVLIYWNHFGLDTSSLAVLARIRPSVGGIAVGIFISLAMSGQLCRIGRRRKPTERKEQSEQENA